MKNSRLAVNLIFALNGFTYANWVSRIPRFQEWYDLSHGGIGLALLCLSIGAIISMPLTGWLIVRAGSRRLTAIGAIIFCLIHPLLAWMPNAYFLMGIFVLMGIFTGGLDVAMNAQAVVIEDKIGRPIMSFFHALFSGGMMLGAACGALFVRLGFDLTGHLLAVGLITLPVALWSVRHLAPDGRTEVATGHSRKTRLQPALIVLGLIAFCCMLGEGAMADWSTSYLEKVAGATRYWAPAGLAAFSGAMMLGRLFGDRLRLRFGDGRLLRMEAIIAIAGLALALGWTAPWAGVLGFLLVGLGLSTIVPIAYSTAGRLPGIPPGLGISMVSIIGYTGFLIGPPVIGFLGDWIGLRGGLAFVLLLFLLMLVLTVLRMRQVGNAAPLSNVKPNYRMSESWS